MTSINHPVFARLYPHMSRAMDQGGIAGPGQALREAFRVLKPGGQLRFLEHVRAGTPSLARLQRMLEASIWPALFGGCHLSRDTATAIEHAGFTIDQVDRFLSPRPAPRSLSTSAAPPHRP